MVKIYFVQRHKDLPVKVRVRLRCESRHRLTNPTGATANFEILQNSTQKNMEKKHQDEGQRARRGRDKREGGGTWCINTRKRRAQGTGESNQGRATNQRGGGGTETGNNKAKG